MTATVRDIISLMETIAPLQLAERWDNPGLQLGSVNWPVRKIWTALDPCPEVVEAACRHHVDMLITHHPLLFNPIKSIDIDTPTGQMIARAVQHRLTIYTAHTNLDSVADGLNDILAHRLGLKETTALQALAVRDEKPADDARAATRPQGLGRIGDLMEKTRLKAFALHIKKTLGLRHVVMIGDPDLWVRRVAVCTGSGSGLLDAFFASGAQVYVSGDLRYHDARNAEANHVGLVDIGHFASEHLMVAAVCDRLVKACAARNIPVEVEACDIEQNPFVVL